ncbi:SusC/RagA family TonB-linked outer membrane protein [uncultured Bacteroides sp.]|uniref:SusC/RagA family TonB-linked outer membrane protein n=1 Tax=uncultured Bacteroides sp. TaxID=162156 RepID=UPI002AA8EEBC|nr:SusC/RagA family TonB-linked outer membrane protein [uncultured Bacteroides sp.]
MKKENKQMSLKMILLLAGILLLMPCHAEGLTDGRKEAFNTCISKIAKKYRVDITYDESKTKMVQVTPVNEKTNATVEAALASTLSTTGFSYRKLSDNSFVIVENGRGSNSMASKAVPRKVTGSVTTATGEPMVGVTIIEKGTTNGTVTDIDGRFSLQLKNEDAAVDVSFVGYVSRSIRLTGNDKIVLQENAKMLNEVVVTALGISRETKSLGYSVQKVDGSSIQESHETNFVNALSNKIAGVQVTSSSGGIGASSSIQIRGQNFVGGYNYNNSPLFVVDGVPISNNNEQSTRSFTGRQDYNNPNFTSGESEVDYSNAAAEINQEDIESVTVLKGPNASALYGARAANGVILITTKSGKGQKGMGVSFISGVSFETPLRLPEFQNSFGQGIEGKYAYADGAGGGLNDNQQANWGPALNGQLITQFDSPIDASGTRTATPFVSHGNQLKDFLQTGHTFNNTITLSNANDKLNYRFSYTNSQQKGIVPNTDLTKNTIGLNSGYQIVKGVRVDAVMNYVHTNSDNRASTGAKNSDNIMKIFLYMPRNVSLNSLQQQWRTGYEGVMQNTPFGNETSTGVNNPYFVVYNNLNGNTRDRVYGNAKLTLELLKGLSLQLRSGLDFYSDKRTMRHANTSASFFNGYYQEDDINFLETNNDFLLTYKLPIDLIPDFGLSASFGGNLMSQTARRLGAIAPELTIPNVYNLSNNAKPLIAGNTLTRKKVNSWYGTTQFSYKNGLFLDLTGRYDYSSALPKENNSYFYPSASLSAVLTDLFPVIKSNILSFVKLRGSTSMVRRDLEPYQTSANYIISQGWGGNSVATANNNYPNSDIKPEKVVSYEFGGDFRLLDNRISVDVTYYNSATTDLIIPITLNPSAGYDTKLMNVGKMTNKGLELMVNVTPVRTKDFQWDVTFNFAKNTNKVVRLAEDQGISRIRQIERWASLELRTENTKGDGSYGSLYGDYLIYKDGQLQLKNGLPMEENGDWGLLGNVNPDWTGGLGTELKYKNWTLSALLGIQEGGSVYSRTYIEGMRAGTLKESLALRDADGTGMIVADGIDVNTGQKNTIAVPVRQYVQSYYDNDNIATFDASYIKLREVKLGYKLPRKWLSSTPFQNVSFSAYGRNLFLWTDVPNIDPEVASYDGQLKGIETMATPSTKSFGFNINITL